MTRYVHIAVLMAAASGCATPKLAELQDVKPNTRFTVKASLGCLYKHGVEHASSYTGMSEPRFTWYKDPESQYAWFRQPLTLVELEALSNSTTEVRRSQTDSARAFEQGNELLKFLRANPCRGE